MIFKAFRKLDSPFETGLVQLIGYIETTSMDLAMRRAMHIASFTDWAGNPGLVFQDSDPACPENWSESKYEATTLDGSIEHILDLDQAKAEIKARNDALMLVREEYEVLKNT